MRSHDNGIAVNGDAASEPIEGTSVGREELGLMAPTLAAAALAAAIFAVGIFVAGISFDLVHPGSSVAGILAGIFFTIVGTANKDMGRSAIDTVIIVQMRANDNGILVDCHAVTEGIAGVSVGGDELGIVVPNSATGAAATATHVTMIQSRVGVRVCDIPYKDMGGSNGRVAVAIVPASTDDDGIAVDAHAATEQIGGFSVRRY
mmetsp:Transcript_19463/g.33422  ORF Transcript_19463/g.33422 Transcript_19463/m.33422 type:complete len:204 (-) Transcript_19463:584-1195(-)